MLIITLFVLGETNIKCVNMNGFMYICRMVYNMSGSQAVRKKL